jgi:deazaflavin-dependent oxidoreductase (nitroreductase family)
VVRAEPTPMLCAGVAFGGMEAQSRAYVERVGVKHRIVHFLQKYVLNVPIKSLFAMGVVPPGYALLETIGRKSGKPRRTPVGDGRVGAQFWIVAEHGRHAGYVRNIEANPRVRIKTRDGVRGSWYRGTAHILADDDPRARQRWLATQVRGAGRNAAAVRFFGTELLTVRIDFDE